MTSSPLLYLLLTRLLSAICTVSLVVTWWRGREARARQTVTSVADSRVMEGENRRQEGMERRITFSFSPFSFPLDDSEKLMKEQYDNLLFCYFMLFTVLSGLGRYGTVAELSQL